MHENSKGKNNKKKTTTQRDRFYSPSRKYLCFVFENSRKEIKDCVELISFSINYKKLKHY